MRRAVVMVALLVAASSGCVFEAWVGAGVARTKLPGEREYTNAWTAGASSGFYLDPIKTKTRLGFSRHIDQTYVGKAIDIEQTQARGWSSARLDVRMYTKGERYVSRIKNARRLTAIASWGARRSVTITDDLMDMEEPPPPPTGRPYKLFLGFTRDQWDIPGKLWGDAISWSFGPYVTHWNTGALGTVESAGLEVRLTMALSPLGLLSFGGGVQKGVKEYESSQPKSGAGSSSSGNAPSKASPAPTCTTRTITDCSTGMFGRRCVERTVCD